MEGWGGEGGLPSHTGNLELRNRILSNLPYNKGGRRRAGKYSVFSLTVVRTVRTHHINRTNPLSHRVADAP